MSLSHGNPTDQQGYFILYYFPSQPWKNPFGHLAVGDFKIMNQHQEAKDYSDCKDFRGRVMQYLSFRPGDGTVMQNPTTFYTENDIYKHAIILVSPLCSLEKLKAAIKNFSELELSSYNPATKTCVTAVKSFLKDTAVFPKEKYNGIRPQYIAKRFCDLLMKGIQLDRQKIMHKKYPSCLEKIEALLGNDIKRLELTIKLDEISHQSMVKDAGKKTKKIDKLKEMQTKVRAKIYASKDVAEEKKEYEDILMQFIDCKSELKDETARKLQECIEQLPAEKISGLGEALERVSMLSQESKEIGLTETRQRRISEFTLSFAKLQRQSIINDPNIEGMKKIHQLIANDIDRLRATLSRDKNSAVAVIFKDMQKKIDKIARLKQLESLFSAPAPVYTLCLKELLESINKLEDETAAGLTQCLKYFPFDKTNAIPGEIESYLKMASKGETKYKEQRIKQIKSEHDFSMSMLENHDCDNPVREISKLISFAVERLTLQSDVDQVSFIGRKKDSKGKDNKKESLLGLNAVFSQVPLNLEKCIAELVLVSRSEVMKDPKVGANKTGKLLKQCIEYFPYDSLPSIEAKRALLTNLIEILPDNKAIKKLELFDKLNKLLEPKQELNTKTSKEIYEIYSECEKLFSKTNESKKIKAVEADSQGKALYDVMLKFWRENDPYKARSDSDSESKHDSGKFKESPTPSQHRISSPSENSIEEENDEEIKSEEKPEEETSQFTPSLTKNS